MATGENRQRRKSNDRFLSQWALPNIAVLGYAIYLAINATSLWGGVFPFFPEEFRTAQVTFFFTIFQATSFLVMLLAAMVCSYWGRRMYAHLLPVGSTVVSFIGSALLISALYLYDLQIELAMLAGVFLGVGNAGFALLWQRYFSSLSAIYGNYYLLLATAFGTVVFLILYLVPIAVTVYLVPLILVPLCGLCAVPADRTIDLRQPLFEDIPCEHPRAYVQVLKDYWRSALAIGALGFISGLVRSTVLIDASLGNILITISMVGSFLASAVLLRIWRRGAFTLDMRTVFLVLFPLVAVALIALPFSGPSFTPLLSGVIYALFVFAFLVMLLQCMQTSRDRGMNPLFVFGFFGGIVYLMQDIGLVLGYAANITTMFGQGTFPIVALFGMFALAMVLYLIRGDARIHPTVHAVEEVEFIAQPMRPSSSAPESEDAAPTRAALGDEDLLLREAASLDPVEDARVSDEAGTGADSIAVRCQELKKQFLLTNRETEIMELFARGYSMPSIAGLLVVSENTVRTHSKHLYTKLGIHKRQELIDLLQQ